MLFYIPAFVVAVMAMAYMAMAFPKYKRVQLDGGLGYRTVKLPNALLVIIITVLFIGVSGHRGLEYADTGGYAYAYAHELTSGYMENEAYASSQLFWLIAAGVRKVSNINTTWFLLVFAILTITPIVWTFYKYSERFEISLFFFITLGSYFVSMNAMRQCVASAVMFFGYKFFMNKKWFLFFAFVGIAYFLHPSAVVMIPIFFYCHRPAWQPLATGVVVAVVLALMFVPSFTQTLFSILGDSEYSKYEDLWGATIIRPIMMTAVCVFAFVNRRKLHNAFPQSDILVNMLVIHTVILFAATNSWVIARLTIYTDLYVGMLVPMMVISCFDKSKRNIAIGAIMVFFLAYHIYEYKDMGYYSVTLGINN